MVCSESGWYFLYVYEKIGLEILKLPRIDRFLSGGRQVNGSGCSRMRKNMTSKRERFAGYGDELHQFMSGLSKQREAAQPLEKNRNVQLYYQTIKPHQKNRRCVKQTGVRSGGHFTFAI